VGHCDLLQQVASYFEFRPRNLDLGLYNIEHPSGLLSAELRGEVLEPLSRTINILKVGAHQMFRVDSVLYVPLNWWKVACAAVPIRFVLPMAAGQANRSNVLDFSLFRYFILADRSRA
jgi:hypothetical protein